MYPKVNREIASRDVEKIAESECCRLSRGMVKEKTIQVVSKGYAKLFKTRVAARPFFLPRVCSLSTRKVHACACGGLCL